MRKFVFTLEPLLKVKKIKKKKLEKDMAKAKQRLEKEQALLQQMKLEKKSIHEKIERLLLNGVKTSELKEYGLYFQLTCERMESQADICRQIENECETIKAALIDMHKQIDMLERLKDEQFREYIYELGKIQEKTIEELVNFNLTTRGERMHG